MNELPEDNATDAPCACALVARTVALMTEWADPHPAPDASFHRMQIARQLVSDLYFLRNHPGLSPQLREAMGKAQARWVALAQSASSAAATLDADSAGLPHFIRTGPLH